MDFNDYKYCTTCNGCCVTDYPWDDMSGMLKNFSFAGGFNFYDSDTNEWHGIYIDKVMYSNPATIVVWSDGTKTVTKVHGGDVYNPEVGLIMCVLKKLYGSTKVHDLLHQWIPEKAYSERACVTVKDVRKAEKAKKHDK